MKNLFLILALASIMISARSQEPVQPFQDVNQDDLGNVTDEFQEFFFEALKQKGIENYEKAIIALNKCLSLEGDKAVIYFELGKNYRELKKFDNAIENFQKAHELKPEKESILVHLYETYRSIESYTEAISVVQKLLKMDNGYQEDLVNLYMLSEDYDKALKMLDDLDAQMGANAYRTSVRRQIYARTNNTGAQIQNLEESISNDPDVEQNYLNLIYIYSEQGEEEEAFKVAEQLLKANPGSSIAHLALYKFYLNKGNTEAAVASMKIVFESEEIDADSKFKVLNDFLNFVQDNPDFEEELIEVTGNLIESESAPGLYAQLGKYYLKKGNKTDALKFFELAIEVQPDDYELLRHTLILQLEAFQFEKVKTLSEQALETFPSQPLFYLFNAVAKNRLENFEAASEVLLDGLDYIIDDIQMEKDFYAQLAIAYRGMNNAEKSEEYRRKAENL